MIKFNPFKYTKNISSFCRYKVNTLGKLLERSPKKDYVLLEKSKNKPIDCCDNILTTLPSTAVKFDVVKVGKKSNPDFLRTITSFYSAKDLLVARFFQGSDIYNKAKFYDNKLVTNSNGQIFNARNVKTKVYNPDPRVIEKFGMNPKTISICGRWKNLFQEDFYFTLFKNDKDNMKISKKMSVIKTEYNDVKQKIDRNLSITEYPANFGAEPKSNLKKLSLNIKSENGKLLLPEILPETNIKPPQNDEFLSYRLMAKDDKCLEMPKYYIDKLGLSDLNIKVVISDTRIPDEKTGAIFSPKDKTIYWNKVPKDFSIVAVSAHESEHAYQYSQIGRSKEFPFGYEREANKKLGPIKDSQELKEAEKYLEASINYPKDNDPDFKKKYMANYLEINAFKTGEKASSEYIKGQLNLKNIFKYVPDDKNIF